MRYVSYFTLIAGATAMVLAATATAQAEDESNAVETPAFVDLNGDGINDNAAMRHRRAAVLKAQANREQNMAYRSQVDPQLTDDQRAAIEALVVELRAQDTAREDIHTAVTSKLIEFGVTLPENWGGNPPDFAGRTQLTNEQRVQLGTLSRSMIADGASREQIREAIANMYSQWGVAPPPGHGGDVPVRQVRRGVRVAEQRMECAPPVTE